MRIWNTRGDNISVEEIFWKKFNLLIFVGEEYKFSLFLIYSL